MTSVTEFRQRLADQIELDVLNMLHRLGSLFTNPDCVHEPRRIRGSVFRAADKVL
ncbi:hypothetical protein [Streptomyces sp. NPDC048419]|uniref:hypothetical protein n=1 Tax=Streptomyces sp. NPDC048419 TaxID=3365547 RepID=UPI0037146696